MAGAGDPHFEEFLEIRRHVKRLQTGTPLLLRAVDEKGQEDLQICTFWVTSDLQQIKWREQEGSGSVCELPISAIAKIVDESTGANDEGDDHHYAITLLLKAKSKKAAAPASLGLICSSVEDLVHWREGLKFLVEETNEDKPAKAEPPADQQQLRLQEELCQRLQQENAMLREIVKRKDATIAELLRDQSKAGTDRFSKTESTSRESDEHLQFREVAILRRKNRRLQKDLKAKQQTITELLQLLGKVTQQQGAESSAQEEENAEEAGEDDDEEEEEEEEESPQPTPAKTASKPTSPYASTSPAPLGSLAPSPGGPRVDASSEAASFADILGGEFGDEMRALAGKIELLEKAAAASMEKPHPGSPKMSFQPPARTGKASAAQSGPGPKAAAALDALAQEMQLLEEKKRVVEELARTLEPGAGEEEDDGFPLR